MQFGADVPKTKKKNYQSDDRRHVDCAQQGFPQHFDHVDNLEPLEICASHMIQYGLTKPQSERSDKMHTQTKTHNFSTLSFPFSFSF